MTNYPPQNTFAADNYRGLKTDLFHIKVKNLVEALGTDGTEGRVVAHHAAHGGSVDAVGMIAGTFVNTKGAALIAGNVVVGRGGNGGIFGQHRLPLLVKMDKGGDVGLGGFGGGRVSVGIAEVFVDIFVGQATDAVAQFMRQHHAGHAVERAHGIVVVDAATAIGLAVGHDDDVVAGCDADGVVEAEEVHGHEVAVGTKGVVAGAHKAADKDAFVGIGDARLAPGGGDAPDVEIVFAAGKGFLAEEVLAEFLQVGAHLGGVGRAIAFGHDDDINFLMHIAHELKLYGLDDTDHDTFALAQGTETFLGIVSHDGLGEEFLVGATLFPTDVYRTFGPGQAHDFLKELDAVFAFRGIAIFVEEAVETAGIDDFATFGILHHDAEKTVVERVDELGEGARPLRKAYVVGTQNGVGLTVASALIVDTQGGIFKILGKLDFLRHGIAGGEDKNGKNDDDNFLLHNAKKRVFIKKSIIYVKKFVLLQF